MFDDDTTTIQPDDGGPQALARTLVAQREALGTSALASWLFGDIEGERLIELLTVVFELSFRKDEGRHPRFTLVVPSKRETSLIENASVTFDPPVPLHVHALRRLASAVPQRPHALLVQSMEEGLMCVGIGRFETAGAMLPEDQTGMYLRAEGLVVGINGPGDLTVQETRHVHSLAYGRIERRFNGNRTLEVLPEFDALRDRVLTTAVDDHGDLMKQKVGSAVRDAWMYVLKSCVELEHGGAFALLPTDAHNAPGMPGPWRDQIDIAYPTSAPHLLEQIAGFVETRWGKNSQSRIVAVRTVSDAAYSLARLSATDGFVLLNRHLKVLGFGAKIGFDKPLPRSCVEVDETLDRTEARYDIARAGTRHRAAYRLAASVPGALVFVVSQDGELRLFMAMDEEVTVVTAPLAPVTYLFQGV